MIDAFWEKSGNNNIQLIYPWSYVHMYVTTIANPQTGNDGAKTENWEKL